MSSKPLLHSRILHRQFNSFFVPKARPLPYGSQNRHALNARLSSSTATNDDSEETIHYDILESVESIWGYCPGGYHPLTLGELLHDRYRVIHKLGYGSSSTVWLARDEQSDQNVALKVGESKRRTSEVDIITALGRSQSNFFNVSGEMMIPTVLDTFKIRGPNGVHPCYVTTTCGPSLRDLKGEWSADLFQIDVARALAAQLVLAVELVHAQGIVHGDIHLGNILLHNRPNFNKLPVKQIYKRFRKPQLQVVSRADGRPNPRGVPSHLVTPIWLGKACERITLAEARIQLIDFGDYHNGLDYMECSLWNSSTPECRFEKPKPPSFPSDVWAMACTIWEIIANFTLFEKYSYCADDITRDNVEVLGMLPPEWWSAWGARAESYREDGTPIKKNEIRTWEARFENSIQKPRNKRGMPLIGAREREAIFNMLRPMLKYRPEDRCTTRQVLESEWMVQWALPEYEKAKRLPWKSLR
ncbi:kinase-like protein [Aaosphaeria arxii CBS 175.79]|uniref:non-specific serine/threonine protein kinase n=1 Tax=Aaosphaeria arxii CBS 175.79 TaxID=1450172 RepID=A0A6A5XF41_9PLEO|nr:kinase-like protein [Aaosphaeria arxii CBS 175.79]KAF2011004.1 kinase-like protein [Aaosphaeria arxii CBS 175.79]